MGWVRVCAQGRPQVPSGARASMRVQMLSRMIRICNIDDEGVGRGPRRPLESAHDSHAGGGMTLPTISACVAIEFALHVVRELREVSCLWDSIARARATISGA